LIFFLFLYANNNIILINYCIINCTDHRIIEILGLRATSFVSIIMYLTCTIIVLLKKQMLRHLIQLQLLTLIYWFIYHQSIVHFKKMSSIISLCTYKLSNMCQSSNYMCTTVTSYCLTLNGRTIFIKAHSIDNNTIYVKKYNLSNWYFFYSFMPIITLFLVFVSDGKTGHLRKVCNNMYTNILLWAFIRR
jgi:hypothetical protein